MSKMILTKEGLIREEPQIQKENHRASITDKQLKNLVKEVTKVLKNIQK